MIERTPLIVRAFLALLLTVALAACGTGTNGSGNGDGDGTDDVGFVGVTESTEAGSSMTTAQTHAVSGGGAFVRFDASLPSDFADDPYASVIDTCTVNEFTGGIPSPIEDFPIPDQTTFLDAGNPISIEAAGQTGTYLELTRQSVDGSSAIVYSADAEVSGPLASGLTASIPGDEFPGVTLAPFPTVEALSFDLPSGVDVDTTFTWDASTSGDDTVVTIGISSTVDIGDPDFDLTFVHCLVQDDGQFEFPEDTRAELGSGFAGTVDSAGRQGYSVTTVGQGNATLVLTVERLTTFPLPDPTPIPDPDPLPDPTL